MKTNTKEAVITAFNFGLVGGDTGFVDVKLVFVEIKLN
ncbi:hypothetical protein POKO110462_08430 [Pontibacter korlensis]